MNIDVYYKQICWVPHKEIWKIILINSCPKSIHLISNWKYGLHDKFCLRQQSKSQIQNTKRINYITLIPSTTLSSCKASTKMSNKDMTSTSCVHLDFHTLTSTLMELYRKHGKVLAHFLSFSKYLIKPELSKHLKLQWKL